MKHRAIFVAPLQREAHYWATAWGFRPGEWVWVGRPEHLLGRRAEKGEREVFVCGSQEFRTALLQGVELAGFDTLIDAHDLDTNREPRSALDLVR